MTGPVDLVYLFNHDVEAVERSGLRVSLTIRDWQPVRFTAKSAGLAEAIMALRSPGATIEQLTAHRDEACSREEFSRDLLYYLERFARGRFLAWELREAGTLLGRAEALASRFQPGIDPGASDRVVTSRFAYLRRDGEKAVLETSTAPVRLDLSPEGLARVAPLLAGEQPAPDGSLAQRLRQLGFFESADAEESEVRRCWEFHDLLMHQKSRSNRDIPAIGGTYRFKDTFPSLPARRPPVEGEQIALPAIDADTVLAGSAPLQDVQARRQSIRRYNDAPIELTQISEFLWRACRTVREIDSTQQSLLTRPYPAGGSINELEFYLAVRRCEGLSPGIYHYDGHKHALVMIANTEPVAQKIVTRSSAAMGLAENGTSSDVVVVITSRFPRLAWKYEGMAYRATLLNAGVVLGLMYLIASDMKLAPCANGTGDSRLLEEAAGLDPYAETPIAEFALSLPG